MIRDDDARELLQLLGIANRTVEGTKLVETKIKLVKTWTAARFAAASQRESDAKQCPACLAPVSDGLYHNDALHAETARANRAEAALKEARRIGFAAAKDAADKVAAIFLEFIDEVPEQKLVDRLTATDILSAIRAIEDEGEAA